MVSSLSGSRGPAGSGQRGNVIPKGHEVGQLQKFTPEQMSLFQNMFSHAGPDSYLSKLAGGDQSAFAPQEELARKDFGASMGQLGSRFSEFAPGAMSAQSGSGFQNAGTQAAQDFSLQLSARRQKLQRQALQDLKGLSGHLLDQNPYEQFLIKKQQKQSWLQKILGVGLPAAGAVAGGIFGGPAGAAAGGQLGGTLASGFNGQQGGGSYEGISSLPNSWKKQQPSSYYPEQFSGDGYDSGDLSSIYTQGGFYG